MKVVLASSNAHKISEIDALLSKLCPDIKVASLREIGFDGGIDEDGSSFEENAVIKAACPASWGYIGIADDSGLCVDALGGAPGIYSARYSGEGACDERNNEKLLKELEDVPDGRRGASFVCVMACVVPEDSGIRVPEAIGDKELSELASLRSGKCCTAFTVRGECRGQILSAARGNGGFGYDPLFFVPEKKLTFSQLSAADKNEISHRGRAMKKFIRCFAELL